MYERVLQKFTTSAGATWNSLEQVGTGNLFQMPGAMEQVSLQVGTIRRVSQFQEVHQKGTIATRAAYWIVTPL